MLTWNVTGLTLDQVPTFIEHLSLTHPWGFVFMQEGFRTLEGITTGGNHLVLTPSSLQGGLRCPAILVRDKWAERVHLVGGGTRWLAAEFNAKVLLISAHFPHKRLPIQTFTDMLEEIGAFMERFPTHIVFMGADLNARLSGATDYTLVGPAIPYAILTAAEQERATMAHEFVTKHSLMLCNTWADGYHDNLHFTRKNWNDTGEAQVDFMLASSTASVRETGVDHHTHFNTDHRPVSCEAVMGGHSQPSPFVKCLRNWKPALSWNQFAVDLPWQWQSWETCAATWREAAKEHQASAATIEPDLELQALIVAVRRAGIEEKRIISKKIWRRRRHLRRLRELERLDDAAATGRAPPRPRPSCHLNWLRIFGNTPAKEAITEYFVELFGLPQGQRVLARGAKAHWIAVWRDLRIDLGGFTVSATRLQKAIGKLKCGKSSPDGITAEMLKSLPQSALQSLAADLSR